MYRFLGHPSEELIEVEASTLEDVFIEAAVALFELMTDTAELEISREFAVSLESPERHMLFIDWLNHLLYLHEVENVFLRSFSVTIKPSGIWKLEGTARGQEIQPGQERRLHAKSVTYGQFEWKETQAGHQVRFVVDI